MQNRLGEYNAENTMLLSLSGWVLRATVTLALTLLTACSSPSLPPLPEDGVILAFGDSLTFGVGAASKDSYPSVLAELTDRRVVNAGISGETTAEGLERFSGVLAETSPSLVILIEGGNDILRNKNLTDAKANLSAMLRLAQQRDIPVVLLGVPEKNLLSSYAGFYQELADEHEVLFVPDLLVSLLRKPAFKSDLVHLNGQGYRALAEALHALLQDEGALN